jgi:hypothetical protein
MNHKLSAEVDLLMLIKGEHPSADWLQFGRRLLVGNGGANKAVQFPCSAI